MDVDTFYKNKKRARSTNQLRALPGAGDRGRTDTVSLPLDFESSTSTNSITPAHLTFLLYHTK